MTPRGATAAIIGLAVAPLFVRPPGPPSFEPLLPFLAGPATLLAVGLLATLLPAFLGAWRRAIVAGSVVLLATSLSHVPVPAALILMAQSTANWGTLLLVAASLSTRMHATVIAMAGWATVLVGISADSAPSEPIQFVALVGGAIWGVVFVASGATLHRAWEGDA